MQQTVRLIALRTVTYSDSRAILTAYSREYGRMSFLIPVGAGREATRRRSILQPLALVECIANTRPANDISRMSEPRPLLPLHNIRANPIRAAIATFIAELLSAALRESQPDPALFDYLATAIPLLDTLPPGNIPNYHICFIYHLGEVLGISPDTETYRPGAIFDFRDGIFRLTPPPHTDILTPQASEVLHTISRITFANMHRFLLTRTQRAEIIAAMLRYISIHHTPLPELRSLPVLHMLFD